MSTPTHHSSITNFFNECEPGPEESQISLDSSIDESNMFAEVSAHSRFSNLMNRSRAASQSLLGPLEEDPEGSDAHTPSLSKNSSDAENRPADANTAHTTSATLNSNSVLKQQNAAAAASTRSASTLSQIVGGILKPSQFNPLSDPPPPPPPNPPPPSKQQTAKTKQTDTKQTPVTAETVKEQSQSTRSGFLPILSVTTLLGKGKSEDTDSAFMNTMYKAAATTAAPHIHPTATANTGGDPSQRTSATFGVVPGNVPSETLHTSNLLRNSTTSTSFNAREADRMAAWAIHIALIFFCGLVIASVLISFTVIRNYGFVALVGLMIVVVFVGFLAVFVDQTILSKNAKLRPIRQKIAAAVNATKGLIVEEYHLLVRDWNEHLLLTQGEEQYQAYSEQQAGQTPNSGSRLPPPTVPGRKRSKLFKLVKPFLGIKKKFGRGKKKRQAQQEQSHVVHLGSPDMLGTTGYVTSEATSSSQQLNDYQPPEMENASEDRGAGVMA